MSFNSTLKEAYFLKILEKYNIWNLNKPYTFKDIIPEIASKIPYMSEEDKEYVVNYIAGRK